MITKRDVDITVALISENDSNASEQPRLVASFNTSEIPDDISSKFDLEMSNEATNVTVTLMVRFANSLQKA